MPKNVSGMPQTRSKRRSSVKFATPDSESPLTRRKGGSRHASRFSISSARKTKSNRCRNSDARSLDYFDSGEPTFVETEPEDYATTDEEDETLWEDEATMLSDLLQESSEDTMEYSTAEHLVNKLQPTFDAESRSFKKELASAFVPVIREAASVIHTLDTKNDKKLTAGILAFNEACKGTEASHIRIEDNMKEALMTFQKTLDRLADQLKDTYEERERIWDDYQTALDALVDPVKKDLQALPGICENRICTLEKEAKKIEKSSVASRENAGKKVQSLLRSMI